MRRHIIEWGLKKPASSRNNVWKYVWKYDNCPKKTSNDWEYHTICDIMEVDVCNTTVNDWDLRSITVDCEKISDSNTGQELMWKVPKAWEKHKVTGVVANVTDCETSMVKMGNFTHTQL